MLGKGRCAGRYCVTPLWQRGAMSSAEDTTTKVAEPATAYADPVPVDPVVVVDALFGHLDAAIGLLSGLDPQVCDDGLVERVVVGVAKREDRLQAALAESLAC